MNRCLTKLRGLPAAEAAKHLNVSKPSNLIAHPTRGTNHIPEAESSTYLAQLM